MNRLKGMLGYLAGPMEMVADNGVEWRLKAQNMLWKRGCGVLNPCDKASDIGDESQKTKRLVKLAKEKGYFEYVERVYKPIVSIDLRMVDIAHFLIMYVDNSIHMCGSYAEQTWAVLEKKPVIIFCKQGKEHIPNWLFGVCRHQMMFSSLDEVEEYLRHIDEDPVVDDLKRWRFFDFDKVFNIKRLTHTQTSGFNKNFDSFDKVVCSLCEQPGCLGYCAKP